MEKVQARVLIEGRVQGVSFRYYTLRKAIELGLTGFVRNLSDGRVEAVFEGEKETVEQMLRWCERGSPHARVDSVAVYFEETITPFHGFNVRY